jgi:hypothetical protein
MSDKNMAAVKRMKKVTAGNNWAYIPYDCKHIFNLGNWLWYQGPNKRQRRVMAKENLYLNRSQRFNLWKSNQ